MTDRRQGENPAMADPPRTELEGRREVLRLALVQYCRRIGWKNYSRDEADEWIEDFLRATLSATRPAEDRQPQDGGLAGARRLVDRQAEDEGLWFQATTVAEAYLQQELRRLHAAVEGWTLTPVVATPANR